MSRIFISHSSKDNFAARAVADWLAGEGWDDVFLDIDPEHGIRPGERWARALHEAAHRCQVVIFLISRHWLASEWCDREFNLSVKLNKRLFGVVIDDIGIEGVPQKYRGAWQLLDLAKGTDHAIFRAILKDGSEDHVTFSVTRLGELRDGLRQAGLDPEFFEWPPDHDPDRSPFRGLAPLEKVDAGVFFGREAPLVDALDRLRGLRETASPRILTILGASGAGKSSFMRAGLLPRLERDYRAFRVLPIIRPQGAPITGESGLVAALAAVLPDVSRATIRNEIAGGEKTLIQRLVLAAPIGGPNLVLPIDQAEELFGAEAGQEARPFLTHLRLLAETASLPLLVLATIRTDRYMQWQNDPILNGLHHETLPLAPMPRGAYRTIIEKPLARYVAAGHELALDPRLTEALLAELEQGQSPDALPLLAFTLEQLFTDYRGDGVLTRDDYQRFGGLEGAISAAVVRALADARGDRAGSPPPPEQLALLKRGLIPWLAGIDPATNSARRKTALWADIPAESQPLMRRLIDARLLRSDRDDKGEQIVEPAHEALLRQWVVLDSWLKDDLAALSTLDGVKDAARAWIANKRNKEFIVHAGSRLAAAEGLNRRKDLASNLTTEEQDYLGECVAAEDERRNRDLDDARKLAEARKAVVIRTRIGLIAAMVAAIVAVGLAAFGFWQFREADAHRAIAEQQTVRVAVSSAAGLASEGQNEAALLLLLSATQGVIASDLREAMQIAFTNVLEKTDGRRTIPIPSGSMPFATEDALLFYVPGTGNILRFDGESIDTMLKGSPSDPAIVHIADAVGGIVFVRSDLSIWRWKIDTEAPERLGRFLGSETALSSGDDWMMHPDGTILWNPSDARERQLFDPVSRQALFLPKAMWTADYYVTQDGERVVSDSYQQDDGAVLAFTLLSGVGVTPAWQPRTFNEGLLDRAIFRACFLRGHSPEPDYDPTLLAGKYSDPIPGPSCIWTSEGILVSTFMATSAGLDRTDTFVAGSDNETDLSSLGIFGSALRDASWVGASSSEETGAMIALLQDRTVYAGDPYGNAIDQRTEPEAPRLAKLFRSGRLALVEHREERIVVYDLVGEATDEQSLPENARFEALNPGTCAADRLGQFAGAYQREDGRTLSFPEMDESLEDAEERGPRLVIDGVLVDFGPKGGCVQVSPDWKRAAVLRWADGRIELYDLDKLAVSATLAEASVAAPRGVFSSVFPSNEGSSLVTSNWGYEVLQWSRDGTGQWVSKLLYLAEKPIEYAEPDVDGGRLLLIEDTGARTLRAFIYSLSAHAEWLNLGLEYKWLAATYMKTGEVLVKFSLSQKVVDPPSLEKLIEQAREALPSACSPQIAGDYRSSPCWLGRI